jgi:hypothetical protein
LREITCIGKAPADRFHVQARLWLVYHPEEAKAAELALADAFEEAFPQDTGKQAMAFKEDYTQPLEVVAQADTWCRVYPDKVRPRHDRLTLEDFMIPMCTALQVRAALEDLERDKADKFETQFPEGTAAKYLFIMRNEDQFPPPVLEAAEAWARLHLFEVKEAEEQMMTSLAEQFEKAFPYDTPSKAAEILQGLGMGMRLRTEGSRGWTRLLTASDVPAGMDATDDRREQAMSWMLFHPKESRKATRMVNSHIRHLVNDKVKHIKELQFQRRMYTDALTKAKRSDATDETLELIADMQVSRTRKHDLASLRPSQRTGG